MNPRTPAASVPCLLLLCACASSGQVPDLGRNPELYGGIAFTSKVPGDRPVFVAPLQDARKPEALPSGQGGFPITYDPDERWSRQVTDMVDDLLRADLAHSCVFAGLLPAAQPGDLVLVPTLTDFQSGAIELDMGARTLAEVGIRVQVLGPAGADGQRQLLHDKVYSHREMSTAAMVPMSTYHLMARAVQVAMQRLVSGLDGSNLSRSHVPAMPVAVPAAAPAK